MPPSPQPIHLTVRMDRELADELRSLARRNERSFSAEARLALRYHLNTNGTAPTVPFDLTATSRGEAGVCEH